MPVYVDPNLPWPILPHWKYGSVSHLYADTPEELHAFALRIGLQRKWCSDITQQETEFLHYDLSPGKRKHAIRCGAVEVPHRHKFSNGYTGTRGRKFSGREGEVPSIPQGEAMAEDRPSFF